MSDLPPDAPAEPQFEDVDRQLARSAVAEPLLTEARQNPTQTFEVIIELNLDFQGGREEARKHVQALVKEAKGKIILPGLGVHPYVFASLKGAAVLDLGAKAGSGKPGERLIYRIWKDEEVEAYLTESVKTIKADAARVSFSASGRGIVWAVIDSGIDGTHPHFEEYKNLELTPPLQHYDYVADLADPGIGPAPEKLVDGKGHGTHVAGIIAGATRPAKGRPVKQVRARQDPQSKDIVWEATEVKEAIVGVAPETKLVSFRILDDNGSGRSSRIIAAIEEILRLNDYGRRNLIHGVNISLGYWFNPRWFGCGHSPLCSAVNRLVRSGVVVVVSAGNSGYSETQVFENMSPVRAAGQMASIHDPGNAELAITVGSVHRNMPHVYGVSYFSSKGPTGDGRRKPDLVAPGEKIISCATGKLLSDTQVTRQGKAAYFVESSGTSMAAPHVSGAIAAFLSIRSEFIGEPEKVKRLFMKSATDLDRDIRFQGAGLVDLMRAIQSV
jgi:subtilisin family serine protease